MLNNLITRLSQIDPAFWALLLMFYLFMGLFIVFFLNTKNMHRTLLMYESVHVRAAIVIGILCMVFWPMAPTIIHYGGLWIFKRVRTPMLDIRS